MRSPRPRTVIMVAGGVLVLGGASFAAAGIGGGPDTAEAHSKLPPATAGIARTTLTDTKEVDGALGYGDIRTVGGAGTGTLTWLAAEGATISRGKAVYKVDQDPVPLLYGSVPVYRTLQDGVEGADAKQLERNLDALGYDGFTVDDEFSSATAAAVQEWQDDLGLPETGVIKPGEVVVAPGRVRMAEHKKQVGDPASGPLFTYTGTSRVVTVNLDVDDQRLARKGAKATVEMPDGDTTEGTITKVGTVATKPENSDTATIEVTITVRDAKDLGTFDQAPVTVELADDQARNVLAVPIAALLALPDGGYGVQVVSGATTRTVPVEVGMFAGGRVEIKGAGLAPGMRVGVPT